jgi:formylmethanofuran dehydrogenase subunit B
VNLARGYPRYNPDEYAADEILRRGEVDACLLVGSEGLRQLSPGALDHLRTIPLIVLDYADEDPPWIPAVRFTTAVFGMNLPGTAYRMDEVPIPLRTFLPAEYPGDHEVLQAILASLS